MFALDFIALSLLHRSEFWFRASGVNVLDDFMDAKHRVLTSLLCSANAFSPFPYNDELRLLIDPKNFAPRRRLYTRLLIRHYESLYEVCLVDIIEMICRIRHMMLYLPERFC